MEFDPSTGSLRSDLLEEDARVAADQGFDYEVTLGRSRAQVQMTTAVESLSSKFASSFGGLQWGEGVTLVAQYKGPVPSEAIEILDAIGLPYRIQAVKHSATELERSMRDVLDRLSAFDQRDIAIAIDAMTQTILVTVNPNRTKSIERPEEMAEALTRETGVHVHVDFIDGPVFVPMTTYGGAELWSTAMNFECTTGYTVYTAGGLTGVATAGHCVPDLPEPTSHYRDPYTFVTHDITFQLSHFGSWGDFGYYTTTGSEVDDFYYGNNDVRRDVLDIKATFAVNDPIQWYGRKTRVQQSNSIFWLNVSAGGLSHLTCAIGGSVTGGDSGGPAFNGSTAAGFITGTVNLSGADRVCFSQARYIDEALGSTFIKTT